MEKRFGICIILIEQMSDLISTLILGTFIGFLLSSIVNAQILTIHKEKVTFISPFDTVYRLYAPQILLGLILTIKIVRDMNRAEIIRIK